MTARQLSDPPGPVMTHHDSVITGADGSRIALRWLQPPALDTSSDPAVLVFYHGGGWVLGEIAGFDGTARRLAAATGCEVVMVEYRLAPEHPYPAAVGDAWHALLAVRDSRPQQRIVVVGDSAGGNLAAVMALRAKAAGVDLACQVLIYPVVDTDFDRASYRCPQNQLLLDAATMRWFWDQYVPDETRRRHPDASPLRAADHRGLAPAIVVTADNDVLADEGEAYVTALRTAGVRVTHRRFEGQMHGFIGMPRLPGSAAAFAFIGDSLAAILVDPAADGTTEQEQRS
ncbi:alpha/beta hydrolase [Microbacterium kribbense]